MANEPAADAAQSQVQQAFVDYLERIDRGEKLSPEDFLKEHPALAPELQSLLFASERLAGMAGSPPAKDTAQKDAVPTVPPSSVSAAALSGPAGSLKLPVMMGRYRIDKELGRGAMGAVYLAHDADLDRPVALKIPKFTGDDNPDLIARFLREARSAAVLSHPNICRVYDVSEYQGVRYIAMEYIEGKSLSSFIAAGNVQPKQAATVIRKLAQGLAEAHKRGIIHRDLKPDNILINKSGEPVLTDFGLARASSTQGAATATQDGMILGSPAYMPPEQAAGHLSEMGPASDVYSLGVVLYELLTGEIPFRGTIVEVLASVLTRAPKTVREAKPDVDPALAAICDKMMAKKTKDRYPSMSEVAQALGEWLKNPQASIVAKLASEAASAAGQTTGPTTTKSPAAKQTLSPAKKAAPERTPQQLQELAELVELLLIRNDYLEAIPILEEIPEYQRTQRIRELLGDAFGLKSNVEKLERKLEAALNQIDMPALKKCVADLLKIHPSHPRAKEIKKTLSQFGKQGIITLLKREGHYHGGGFAWEWWQVAAAVGGIAAIFGSVLFAVIIYISGSKQTIQIEIDDPTAVVKVDGQTVSISGAGTGEVKLTIGNHEFTAEIGDTSVKTNGTYEVKKGKNIPLRITLLKPKPGDSVAGTTPEKSLPAENRFRLDMEFVKVPKGKSWLGGGGGTPGEKEFTVASDFELGKYEVTQEEWEKVMGNNPSHFSRQGAGKDAVKEISDADLKRFPVDSVSWNDCQEFLKKLNEQAKETGWAYRLPNDAEWEYACRGGPMTDKSESAFDFYFDQPTNTCLPSQANFGHEQGLNRTCKVGSYKPNRLGLYDMHGNAQEWVDEIDPGNAAFKVVRGGTFHFQARDGRASKVWGGPPTVIEKACSFRVARVRVNSDALSNNPIVDAKDASPEEVRAALRALIQAGGRVVVLSSSGQNIMCDQVAKIPADDFTVHAIELINPIDDAALARIAPQLLTKPVIKSCVQLLTNSPKLTSQSLPLIARLVNLQTINANASGISDSEFKWLANLTKLNLFYAESTKLTGSGLLHFAGCGQLTDVNLSKNPLDDEGLAKLPAQLKLTSLNLAGTQITDTSIPHLQKLTLLKKLDVSQTNISVSGLAWLRQSLPNCDISGTGNANAKNAAPPLAVAPFDATQAKAHQEAWAKHLGVPVEYTNSIGMTFRLIPPGEFLMGGTPEEIKEWAAQWDQNHPEQKDIARAEGPQHKVRLTRPYYLGIHEVTQQDYQTVMGQNPSEYQANSRNSNAAQLVQGLATSRFPVESVSWDDVQEFCRKLSQKEGSDAAYRLPTEAEWENACRAGTTTRNWNGDSAQAAAEAANIELGRPRPVGEMKANPFGLYDLNGNVWEWVGDWWDPDYYQQFANQTAVDPTGPTTGKWRAVRGCSLGQDALRARSALRFRDAPAASSGGRGFRVALPIEAAPKVVSATDQKSPPSAVAPFDAAKAKAHQAAWAKHLGVPVEYTNSVGMKFRLIPPGEFLMGSTAAEIETELKNMPAKDPNNASDSEYLKSEAPQHKVRLTKPFYLCVTEVTSEQWSVVMGTQPWKGKDRAVPDAQGAANYISWTDAVQFCEKLQSQDAAKPSYRLPTEAEWEYACRGGSTTRFGFGETTADLAQYAWNVDTTPEKEKYPHAVGQKRANAFGLFDMHGNNWEWCSDLYSDSAYKSSPEEDPPGPANGDLRITRGGSWLSQARFLRSATRSTGSPNERYFHIGLRIALPVEAVKAASKPAAPSLAVAPFDAAQAKAHQAAWAKHLGMPVEYTNSLGMKFRLIPPGEYLMGSTPDEPGHKPEEAPQHKVTITKPFYFGETEVTVKQWTDVMKSQPWNKKEFKPPGPDAAANYVSWNDAAAFCEKLRTLDKSGQNYRLPTEAEWEMACRAGTTTAYYFGESGADVTPHAWIKQNADLQDQKHPHQVGQKPPNPYGLFDVTGNVWEWCSDYFDESYYKASSGVDPMGPAQGANRVNRGGSWISHPHVCRTAWRSNVVPTEGHESIGFRVVMPIEVGMDVANATVDLPSVAALPKNITPAALRKKFNAKTTYDAKTGILTLTYDFAKKEQLEDFVVGNSKAAISKRSLVIDGSDRVTHVAKFKSFTVKGIWNLKTMRDGGIFSTNGSGMTVGGLNPDGIYLRVAGAGTIDKIVPESIRSGAIPFEFSVSPQKTVILYGSERLTQPTVKADDIHQIVFAGGAEAYSFSKITISGVPDSNWLQEFLDAK